MLLLSISLALSIAYALLRPIGDGLMDTSKWAAKVLAPDGIQDDDLGRQYLRVAQAALMDGWLSSVPFYTMILGVGAIATAFFYHWWAAIIIIFLEAIFVAVSKLFFGRPVSYYLSFLRHKLANRVADYRRDNDFERAEAAALTCSGIESLMSMYAGHHVAPPTERHLKIIPFGDKGFWLNQCGSGS
jgi:hypothetical protein